MPALSATNSPTTLGLYIAYSIASRLSTGTETPWVEARKLSQAIQHALGIQGSLTADDKNRLLKAASSTLFMLYLLSSYVQSAKNKRLIADEVQIIKEHIKLLNEQHAAMHSSAK